MRKASLIILIALLLCTVSNAWAGLTLYENKELNLWVGAGDVTTSGFYNFSEQELLIGSTLNIVKWEFLGLGWNFDIGGIGDMKFASPICGVSLDEPSEIVRTLVKKVTFEKLDIENAVKVGGFGGRDLNRDIWLYGAYAGVSVSIPIGN